MKYIFLLIFFPLLRMKMRFCTRSHKWISLLYLMTVFLLACGGDNENGGGIQSIHSSSQTDEEEEEDNSSDATNQDPENSKESLDSIASKSYDSNPSTKSDQTEDDLEKSDTISTSDGFSSFNLTKKPFELVTVSGLSLANNSTPDQAKMIKFSSRRTGKIGVTDIIDTSPLTFATPWIPKLAGRNSNWVLESSGQGLESFHTHGKLLKFNDQYFFIGKDVWKSKDLKKFTKLDTYRWKTFTQGCIVAHKGKIYVLSQSPISSTDGAHWSPITSMPSGFDRFTTCASDGSSLFVARKTKFDSSSKYSLYKLNETSGTWDIAVLHMGAEYNEQVDYGELFYDGTRLTLSAMTQHVGERARMTFWRHSGEDNTWNRDPGEMTYTKCDQVDPCPFQRYRDDRKTFFFKGKYWMVLMNWASSKIDRSKIRVLSSSDLLKWDVHRDHDMFKLPINSNFPRSYQKISSILAESDKIFVALPHLDLNYNTSIPTGSSETSQSSFLHEIQIWSTRDLVKSNLPEDIIDVYLVDGNEKKLGSITIPEQWEDLSFRSLLFQDRKAQTVEMYKRLYSKLSSGAKIFTPAGESYLDFAKRELGYDGASAIHNSLFYHESGGNYRRIGALDFGDNIIKNVYLGSSQLLLLGSLFDYVPKAFCTTLTGAIKDQCMNNAIQTFCRKRYGSDDHKHCAAVLLNHGYVHFDRMRLIALILGSSLAFSEYFGEADANIVVISLAAIISNNYFLNRGNLPQNTKFSEKEIVETDILMMKLQNRIRKLRALHPSWIGIETNRTAKEFYSTAIKSLALPDNGLIEKIKGDLLVSPLKPPNDK